MIIVKHSIKINASPKKVMGFFDNLPDNYTRWHPEHISARWVNKTEEVKGSVFTAKQKLGGTYWFTVTKYVKDRLVEYIPAFPRRIFLKGGSFIVKPEGKGCIFTATLTFRFKFLTKLMKRTINKVNKHIAEEGINLKKLLE